jgi:hypothetical protein
MTPNRLARLARISGLKAVSLAAFVALFGSLTAVSVIFPAPGAHACDITRKVYNRTDRNLYIEIWRQGTQQWTSPAIKPGAAMALDYLTIGDEILVTGPGPVGDWRSNPFGVVLEIFRCDIIRISGTSKMGGYDLRVSRRQNAEILIENKK